MTILLAFTLLFCSAVVYTVRVFRTIGRSLTQFELNMAAIRCSIGEWLTESGELRG
jgi:hypothetical protein